MCPWQGSRAGRRRVGLNALRVNLGLFVLSRLRRLRAPVPHLAAPQVHALHFAALQKRAQRVVRRGPRQPTRLSELPHANSRPLLNGLKQPAAIFPAWRTGLSRSRPRGNTRLRSGLTPDQNGPGRAQSLALLNEIIPPTERRIDLPQPPIDVHHLPLHKVASRQSTTP